MADTHTPVCYDTDPWELWKACFLLQFEQTQGPTGQIFGGRNRPKPFGKLPKCFQTIKNYQNCQKIQAWSTSPKQPKPPLNPNVKHCQTWQATSHCRSTISYKSPQHTLLLTSKSSVSLKKKIESIKCKFKLRDACVISVRKRSSAWYICCKRCNSNSAGDKVGHDPLRVKVVQMHHHHHTTSRNNGLVGWSLRELAVSMLEVYIYLCRPGFTGDVVQTSNHADQQRLYHKDVYPESWGPLATGQNQARSGCVNWVIICPHITLQTTSESHDQWQKFARVWEVRMHVLTNLLWKQFCALAVTRTMYLSTCFRKLEHEWDHRRLKAEVHILEAHQSNPGNKPHPKPTYKHSLLTPASSSSSTRACCLWPPLDECCRIHLNCQ